MFDHGRPSISPPYSDEDDNPTSTVEGDLVVSSLEEHGSQNLNSQSDAEQPTKDLESSSELATQVYANPKLADLQSLGGSMNAPTQSISCKQNISMDNTPILADPECSGYFLEPVKSSLVVLFSMFTS